MKSLTKYIYEQTASDKVISFNFSDLDNADDTIESLKDLEYVDVEDKTVKVTVSPSNYDKLGTVQDILQQYYEVEHNSSKRTNNEQYAQLIKSFGKSVGDLNDAIDEFGAEQTNDNDEKKDDKKDEDE